MKQTWSRPFIVALILTGVFCAGWLFCFADWMWFKALTDRPLVTPTEVVEDFLPLLSPQGFVFTLALVVAAAWAGWAFRPRNRRGLQFWFTLTFVYVLLWHSLVYLTDAYVLDGLRAHLARGGLGGFFLMGLAWITYWVERSAQHYEALRALQREESSEPEAVPALFTSRQERGAEEVIWNPLDPEAVYYGKKGKKLNQSVVVLSSYTMMFFALLLISTLIGGCQEIYEMPAGGGDAETIAQKVKVQKIIRKKFVVNPFSWISYTVPPIDEVKLQLTEVTKHAYQIGQGEGSGAGFAGGTNRGKVRFIRLEYTGGDWNRGAGVGGDLNMLTEYGIRTKQRIAKRTESRRVSALKNFPVGKAPPMVYIVGSKSISLSKSEIKILREYLLEKHGMIFADCAGRQFHNQFVRLMRQVLPNIPAVKVPLDDQIHRVPYEIPFLPYASPHGGREALGWKIDGRWVCYYHPGDIGDAWADKHAGVKPEVWEACYQLGTNIIFYAHAEYSKWLQARKEVEE